MAVRQAVRIAEVTANPTTAVLTVICVSSGRLAGSQDLDNVIAREEKPTATPAASVARVIASSKNCRMMRDRGAPSAARIATSRWRATPRARTRAATSAQAINNKIHVPNTRSRTGSGLGAIRVEFCQLSVFAARFNEADSG